MDNAGANPIRRWCTDAAPPAQRLDYWVGAICEGFLEMDATSPDAASPFSSELTSSPFGGIGLNRVRGSAQDVYRTRRAIARSREHFFYLLCNTDSAWRVAQQGRAERLLAGDLVLVDSRRCYEFHFPAVDTLSIELPTPWVESWLPHSESQLARRIDGRSGWGQALSAFVRQLQPELSVKPPLPAPLIVDQLGALLALATAQSPGVEPEARGLRERVLAEIAERHAEPGLTAREIAQALGTSERSLHRSLSGSGITFARSLMQQRMAAAHRLLSDARFDRLTVAEIGRRVGLLDASHFVRQCRQWLGATPGALRRVR